MSQNDDFKSWLEAEQEWRKNHILNKIRDIRHILDGLETRINADSYLNDLGELQSSGVVLDTAIAAYAAQRQTLKNYMEME